MHSQLNKIQPKRRIDAPNRTKEELDRFREEIQKINDSQAGGIVTVSEPTSGVQAVMFDEPSHYHEHGIDTIEFLKQGFPPEVYAHFCLGNIIKYAQRAEYKNGKDDYKKIVDYAKRLVEWVNEKNLGN
jgi:hypothetical protein